MDGDAQKVAEAHGVSMEAMRAALACYRQNKATIDALILLNNAQ